MILGTVTVARPADPDAAEGEADGQVATATESM